MAKWGIPPRGDKDRALDLLIQNSQRLHSTAPGELPTEATLSEVIEKINELLRWLGNKD